MRILFVFILTLLIALCICNSAEQNQKVKTNLQKETQQVSKEEEKQDVRKEQVLQSEKQIQTPSQPETTQKEPQKYCGVQQFGVLPETYIQRMDRKDSHQYQKIVQTIYNFPLYIDIRDRTISSKISRTGTFEPQYINLYGHLIKQGSNVLKVGAQAGLQAILLGKLVGETGKVFVVEPSKIQYKLMQTNIKLNKMQQIVTVYNFAASDNQSKAIIQSFPSNLANSKITLLQQSQTAPHSPVGIIEQTKTDTLDNILSQNVTLDLAIFDANRLQVKALKGLKQTILRSPNLIIMTQWSPMTNVQQQEAKELIDSLKQMGYKIYFYQGGNVRECEIGNFVQIKNDDLLWRMSRNDLFLFPSAMKVPK